MNYVNRKPKCYIYVDAHKISLIMERYGIKIMLVWHHSRIIITANILCYQYVINAHTKFEFQVYRGAN